MQILNSSGFNLLFSNLGSHVGSLKFPKFVFELLSLSLFLPKYNYVVLKQIEGGFCDKGMTKWSWRLCGAVE
jgi:hypothetical protein